MTVAEFSRKYNLIPTRVWDAINLANIRKRRYSRNVQYDEKEMCIAVISYLRYREERHMGMVYKDREEIQRVIDTAPWITLGGEMNDIAKGL